MKTADYILASAMEKLAESIVSDDGIANAAIREAGQRITELSASLGSHAAALTELAAACRERMKKIGPPQSFRLLNAVKAAESLQRIAKP